MRDPLRLMLRLLQPVTMRLRPVLRLLQPVLIQIELQLLRMRVPLRLKDLPTHVLRLPPLLLIHVSPKQLPRLEMLMNVQPPRMHVLQPQQLR